MLASEKNQERRKKDRRRLLTEKEFRKLVDTGKTFDRDRRSWQDRRGTRPKNPNKTKDSSQK